MEIEQRNGNNSKESLKFKHLVHGRFLRIRSAFLGNDIRINIDVYQIYFGFRYFRYLKLGQVVA